MKIGWMKTAIIGLLRGIKSIINKMLSGHNFLLLAVFYCRNIFSKKKCYITCYGRVGGIGSQILACLSTILFARAMHLTYLHTPLATVGHNDHNDNEWEKKWESFFNLGEGELRVDDKRMSVSKRITISHPLMIKKQENALFVLLGCQQYTDIFPNRYSRLKCILAARYYSTPKNIYDLHYIPNKVNIAVHIRRGDVKPSDKDRYTGNKFILTLLAKIQALVTSLGKESSIGIYSEGKISDFDELNMMTKNIYNDLCPFTTFHNLVSADILVMAKSAFSYVAALLSKGIVFYESFGAKPQRDWIEVNGNAHFSSRLFIKKLRQKLQNHF
jgi:hypothetical protein